MRVLCLILASDTHPIYPKHQACWRRYMHSHPDIDAYFYKGDPSQAELYNLEGDTLTIRIEESIANCYAKTILAFQYFLPRLRDYDFVVRPNLSSLFVFDRYLAFCARLPRQNVCSAVIGTFQGIQFPSGCGFTLSRDLVQRIAMNPIPQHYIDDVTIGKMLQLWRIPILRAPRMDIPSRAVYDRADPGPHFHFRLKGEDRTAVEDEVFIMNALIDRLYPGAPKS